MNFIKDSKVLIIEVGYRMTKDDREKMEQEYSEKAGMKCIVIDSGARSYVIDRLTALPLSNDSKIAIETPSPQINFDG